MTERRPHWDDDLITAVCSAAAPEFEDGPYTLWLTSQQVFRIIAAVEDWQSCQAMVNISTSTYAMTVGRAEDAEAAIQRVRELHAPYWDVTEMCRECSDDWPCGTIRALDGDG